MVTVTKSMNSCYGINRANLTAVHIMTCVTSYKFIGIKMSLSPSYNNVNKLFLKMFFS